MPAPPCAAPEDHFFLAPTSSVRADISLTLIHAEQEPMFLPSVLQVHVPHHTGNCMVCTKDDTQALELHTNKQLCSSLLTMTALTFQQLHGVISAPAFKPRAALCQ